MYRLSFRRVGGEQIDMMSPKRLAMQQSLQHGVDVADVAEVRHAYRSQKYTRQVLAHAVEQCGHSLRCEE